MNIQLKNIDVGERRRICDRASDNISRLTSELNRLRGERAELVAVIQNTRNELTNVRQDLADARMAAAAASVGSSSVIGALGSAAVGIAAERIVGELSQRANRLQARLRNMEFEFRRVTADIANKEDLIRQVRTDQRRLNC